MQAARVIVAPRLIVAGSLLLALLAASSPASARRVHVACRDGVLSPPTCPPERPCLPPNPTCDADQMCDGTCTFDFKVCREVTCTDQDLKVRTGCTAIVRITTNRLGGRPTKYILKCLPGSCGGVVRPLQRRCVLVLPHHCRSSADCPPCGSTVGCICVDGLCQ